MASSISATAVQMLLVDGNGDQGYRDGRGDEVLDHGLTTYLACTHGASRMRLMTTVR